MEPPQERENHEHAKINSTIEAWHVSIEMRQSWIPARYFISASVATAHTQPITTI